ncbi:MAG: RNA 2',3'-cyclic phosphodiesterase [Mariprofundus sp.]
MLGYTYGMRLFAALTLSDAVLDELQVWWLDASSYLKSSDWRLVAPHLWHVTLAFYGDVMRDDADDLAESLSECAQSSSPIYLYSSGFGVFPKLARPRIFWAGVEDAAGHKSLKRLAHCCRHAGHATVRKRTAREAAFRGHITLARSRGHSRALHPDLMAAMAEIPNIGWCADRFYLFQSILKPEGPQYRRLETFELNGPQKLNGGQRGKYVR